MTRIRPHVLFAGLLCLAASARGGNELLDAVIAGDEPAVRALIAAHADLNAPRVLTPETQPATGPAKRLAAADLRILSEGQYADRAARAQRLAQTALPLHAAIYLDRKSIAKLLIDAGADLAAKLPATDATPLHVALVRGDLATARLLLEHHAPVDARDRTGQTPLFLTGDEAAAQLLLDAHADVNARDLHGGTALYTYTAAGKLGLAKLLLAHRADPNLADQAGLTPLHAAIACQHDEVRDHALTLLLAAGADANARAADGSTPLHLAVQRGHSPAFLQRLLDAGAKIDAPTTDGATPLLRAVECGRLPAARLLLAARADPNARNSQGNTSLHLALGIPSYSPFTQEFILALVGAGADRTVKDKAGKTAFDLAAEKVLYQPALLLSPTQPPNPPLDPLAFYPPKSDRLKFAQEVLAGTVAPSREAFLTVVNADDLPVVQRMLKAGGDFRDAKTNQQALQQMVRHGALLMIREFLATKPQLPAGNISALEMAIRADQVEIARLLVDAGFAPDAILDRLYEARSTPLILAIGTGDATLVKMLLDHGADPNFPAVNLLPVVSAFKGGNRQIVELFLAHKRFNVNAPDRDANHGMSILHAVAASSDTALLKRLVDMGADLEALYTGSETPLGTAAAYGQVESARMLIAAGAKLNPHVPVNDKTRVGAGYFRDSPLHLAATPELAEMLIAKGAEIDARNQISQTPLMVACHRLPKADVAAVLLKHGANPNLMCDGNHNSAFMTALNFAVLADHVDCVRLLLAAGAIPDPPEPRRTFSVIDIARRLKREEIVTLLTAARAATSPK